ncbi:Uncharacterised protein [Klebsiella pneumoniae]|nr:Uncharacterised protein [Klebsiella pneumoniae]
MLRWQITLIFFTDRKVKVLKMCNTISNPHHEGEHYISATRLKAVYAIFGGMEVNHD